VARAVMAGLGVKGYGLAIAALAQVTGALEASETA
jgi:3-dehydroquinate dehydratase